MGLFENSCRPAKNDHVGRDLEFPLPLPQPPQENHPQLTQNNFKSNIPSPLCWQRDRCNSKSPSTNPVQWTPANQDVTYVIRESYPPNQGPDFQNHQEQASPHQPQPHSLSTIMDQDYPFTGPSPGDTPPIYPPSLPLGREGGINRKMLTNIFPRVMDFFSFSLVPDHKSSRTIKPDQILVINDRTKFPIICENKPFTRIQGLNSSSECVHPPWLDTK